MTPRSFRWASCGLIFTVVVVVFWPAWQGAFLAWDDDINIVNNPRLRELSAENLRWMFTDSGYMRRYVPLAWLNWSIEHRLFGLSPASAHVGNIICHGLNAVGVFLVLEQLLLAWPWNGRLPDGRFRLAAGLGALVWALHPLRVEVVAWASSRMYGQAGFFLLIAVLAYLRAMAAGPGTRARLGWLTGSTVAFGASLLTYPIALTFVGVLVVIDVFLKRSFGAGFDWRVPGHRRTVWEKIPFLAVAGLVAAATLAARFQAQGLWQPPPTLAEFGLGARLAQASYIWAYYVWKPLWPADLAPAYATLTRFDPGAAIFWLSMGGILVVTGLLLWGRRRWPGLLALWLCHLLLLAPMLGLTEHPHYANDRYSYLQGVLGSVALSAWLVRSPAIMPRRWKIGATLAVMAALAGSSGAQVRIWRDSETLFRYLYKESKDITFRADLASRLGDVSRRQQRFSAAAGYYEESLRLDPNRAGAAMPHFGLGLMAHAARRWPEAVQHYEAAVRLDPGWAEAYQALGHALIDAGRAADAVPPLQRAVALQPADPVVHQLLGAAHFSAGQVAESVAAFVAAHRLQPRSVAILCSLASALRAAGRIPEALARSEEAVRLDPTSVAAYQNLGDSLRLSGRWPEGIDALQKAVRLQPDAASSHNLLGTALATAGRLAEAAASFREATRLDPGFAQGYYNLGRALRDSGQSVEAMAAFAAALQLKPDHAEARAELARLQRR